MTEVKKNLILKRADKAIDLFLDYHAYCAEIEVILDRYSTVEILDVLYQMSDGIVVAISPSGEIPDNIPIKDFLERYVK